VKLVPDDAAMVSQLESARAKKQTNDQIMGYLRQADVAKRSGDFAQAQAIVEKAIKLDTNNSRLRAAYNALIRQAGRGCAASEGKDCMRPLRMRLAAEELCQRSGAGEAGRGSRCDES